MQLTWLDNNSWLIEIAGKRILLDPWLVGSLTFGNLNWLFKGTKRRTYPLGDRIDLILLSQGLEDHTHPETLKTLDRNIPVVGSPNAAKVAQSLGYTHVTALSHHQTYPLNSAVTIEAFPGSPIGPQLVENAYLITDLIAQQTLYYEPHGYHSPQLKDKAPINVIIAPIVGISLLHWLPVLQGQNSSLELCQWLQPQVILATASAAETDYEGVLTTVLRQEGTIEDFRQLLAQNQLSPQVIAPNPGEAIDLSGLSQTVSSV